MQVRLAAAVVATVGLAIWSADFASPRRSAFAIASTSQRTGSRDFISYFEDGHADVVKAFGADRSWRALESAALGAEASVVRIRLNYNRRGRLWSTDHGSGFILNGGRHVATAGHVVDRIDTRDDCDIEVALPGGGLVSAHVVAPLPVGASGGDKDWALLELDHAVSGGLRVSAWPRDARVVILGFPEQIGRLRGGRFVADAISTGTPLLPTLHLGELDTYFVRSETAVTVQHGAMPMGGISGGPVVDARGNVVAIDTGTRRTRSHDGTSRSYILVHPVTDLIDALRERAPAAIAD